MKWRLKPCGTLHKATSPSHAFSNRHERCFEAGVRASGSSRRKCAGNDSTVDVGGSACSRTIVPGAELHRTRVERAAWALLDAHCEH